MKIVVRLLTFWIPFSKLRKKVRSFLDCVFLCSPFYNLDIINVRMKAKKVGKRLRIGGKSKFSKSTYIGDYNAFNGIRVMGSGKFVTGNYVIGGQDILVLTQNHNYESDTIPYGKDVIKKDVIIGDCVWMGSRVTLLPGTKIGEGAIIQGGAVVHGEIPAYAIAGGNPAKVFKYRDIEHYNKLKNENKFYIPKE